MCVEGEVAIPSCQQGPVLPGEHRLASSLLTGIDNDIVWHVTVTYHDKQSRRFQN
jgi:hypothetical protein